MGLDKFAIFVVLCSFQANSEGRDSDGSMFDVIFACLDRNTSLSCIASSAARSIERVSNHTLSISQGVTLARNEEPIPTRGLKSLQGFKRLCKALSNFIDTHSFSVDLTQIADDGEETSRAGGRGGGLGGGGGYFNKKAIKRERKYYQYAFMVLLGIFGLTGPLVMKILGVMAAQSLLASKAALIIVGSVALKKLFENDSSKPKVTVATLPVHDKYDSEEELDRLSYGYNGIPHGYSYHGYGGRNSPYAGFYNNERSEFAPVLYGKQKQSLANRANAVT